MHSQVFLKLSLIVLLFLFFEIPYAQLPAEKQRLIAKVDSSLRPVYPNLSVEERLQKATAIAEDMFSKIEVHEREAIVRLSRPFVTFPYAGGGLNSIDLSREDGKKDPDKLKKEVLSLVHSANDPKADWRTIQRRRDQLIADYRGRYGAHSATQEAHASLLYVLLSKPASKETEQLTLDCAKALSQAGYLDPLLRWRAYERLSSGRLRQDPFLATERGRIDRLITRNLRDTKKQLDQARVGKNDDCNSWHVSTQRLRSQTIEAHEAMNRADRLAGR